MSQTVAKKLPIILAVEEFTYNRLLPMIEMFKKLVGGIGYKIHSHIDKYGANTAIRSLRDAGADVVMADLKLHDIPRTVLHRAQVLADGGADIITVHASGGLEMMKKAVESNVMVFAITVLTSLDDEQCKAIYGDVRSVVVLRLAKLAAEAKVTGVVCSPNEVELLRSNEDTRHLKLIVPGTRSKGADHGDQKNVQEPLATLQNGADFLVIGTQVTTSDEPTRALLELAAEIEPALG